MILEENQFFIGISVEKVICVVLAMSEVDIFLEPSDTKRPRLLALLNLPEYPVGAHHLGDEWFVAKGVHKWLDEVNRAVVIVIENHC